jgi:hypothetical protein
MMSEWMKVMIDEIARKKAEADTARAEQLRRSEEAGTSSTPGHPSDRAISRHDAARR